MTGGSAGVAPPFSRRGGLSASRPGRFTLKEILAVPIGYDAACASEPVWTLRRR
jgi:hypothetical protein